MPCTSVKWNPLTHISAQNLKIKAVRFHLKSFPWKAYITSAISNRTSPQVKCLFYEKHNIKLIYTPLITSMLTQCQNILKRLRENDSKYLLSQVFLLSLLPFCHMCVCVCVSMRAHTRAHTHTHTHALTLHGTAVNIRTTCFKRRISKRILSTQYIYRFRMILRTNNDHFPKQR
jgi:hypothetical protein